MTGVASRRRNAYVFNFVRDTMLLFGHFSWHDLHQIFTQNVKRCGGDFLGRDFQKIEIKWFLSPKNAKLTDRPELLFG
jgi:hypothetical protein